MTRVSSRIVSVSEIEMHAEFLIRYFALHHKLSVKIFQLKALAKNKKISWKSVKTIIKKEKKFNRKISE